MQKAESDIYSMIDDFEKKREKGRFFSQKSLPFLGLVLFLRYGRIVHAQNMLKKVNVFCEVLSALNIPSIKLMLKIPAYYPNDFAVFYKNQNMVAT